MGNRESERLPRLQTLQTRLLRPARTACCLGTGRARAPCICREDPANSVQTCPSTRTAFRGLSRSSPSLYPAESRPVSVVSTPTPRSQPRHSTSSAQTKGTTILTWPILVTCSRRISAMGSSPVLIGSNNVNRRLRSSFFSASSIARHPLPSL